MRLDDDGGGWTRDACPGSAKPCGYLAEPAVNELWLGTGAQGVLRVRFDSGRDNPRIDRFGPAQGLGGDTGPAVYAVGETRLRRRNRACTGSMAAVERLLPDTTWQGLSVGGTQDQSAMAEDGQGNVWANFGLETVVFRRQSRRLLPAWTRRPCSGSPTWPWRKSYIEADGVVWFGRDDGLIGSIRPSVRTT